VLNPPARFSGLLATSIAAAALCLGACAAKQEAGTYGENAERDFAEAMEKFQDDDCIAAEPKFRAVARNYPFSRYAALAELRTADCMAMQGQHVEAVEAYRQFTRVRPSHDDVGYAQFKAAEASYQQIPTDWFLAPPTYERDMRPARDALAELNKYLQRYPDDENSEDAAELRATVLKLLAEHELYVARYYLAREHPEAAVRRIETMLDLYEASGLGPSAMLLMGRTQLAMRDLAAAHKTFRDLIARYPKSGMSRQAERYLAATGG